MSFTIFYDGKCPLCVNEMDTLKELNQEAQLRFVNIHQLDEFPEYVSINFHDANAVLHGMTQDGQLLLGLDVTYHAWRAVGKGHWVAPLNWRWLRYFADPIYLLFARHRYTISRWLTGRPRCKDHCSWKP
jgi:predicted DCC family thiol-disulfide oxidoreductase YuxK